MSNCAQRNSRVVPREWTHAKYALDATAVRALAMTADLFQDSSVGADVVAGRTEFAPTVIQGRAAFNGPRRVGRLRGPGARRRADRRARADVIFVATGLGLTRLPPLRRGERHGLIFDSDSIVGIGRVPEHIFIQGGGLIAVEYAFIFERLWAKVTPRCARNACSRARTSTSTSRPPSARVSRSRRRDSVRRRDVVKVTPPAEHGGVGSVELGSGTVVEAGAFLSALGAAARRRA